MDKPIIESAMNQTPAQSEKNKKLRETSIRAENTKIAKNKAKKAETTKNDALKQGVEGAKAKGQGDCTKGNDDKDEVIAECGRNEQGQFVENNIFSVGNGRPPIFTSPDDLVIMIDLYIDDCPDKQTCYTTDGVLYKKKIPTICGLAYFLGFESRQSMYDYKNKDNRFSYIVKRAMLYMEKHYEQILQGKAPTGAIFALKNQGWKDKSEIDVKGTVPTTYNFIIKPKEEE